MAKTRSMTRNQKNHDDEASSFCKKRPMTSARWSDLDYNLLFLVMMQLGVVDFLSFRGVCKSWRSLACENQNMFMASRQPMSITISTDSKERACYFEDFEGRKFKTILPDFTGGSCIGLTCGYIVFFMRETREFRLVNLITRHQLHFPDISFDYQPDRAILVFSPSIFGWVFVVLYRGEIWFSIAGKGAWKHVSDTFHIFDLCAFKGNVYTLSRNIIYPCHECHRLCELRFYPEPKFTVLNHGSGFFVPNAFVSSRETLFVIGGTQYLVNGLRELDLGEMKWVKPYEKTLEEYAFFRSDLNDVVVAIKQELWADPWSRSFRRYVQFYDNDNNTKYKLFGANMWYLPHECMDVDHNHMDK